MVSSVLAPRSAASGGVFARFSIPCDEVKQVVSTSKALVPSSDALVPSSSLLLLVRHLLLLAWHLFLQVVLLKLFSFFGTIVPNSFLLLLVRVLVLVAMHLLLVAMPFVPFVFLCPTLSCLFFCVCKASILPS